mmetsp:Transcript_93526/g.213872  ORF Transcript_93526/g.213872 Transcript_93526/m.213872 type:complete len:1058 (+) Transcript_93526:20-3193(+)
MWGETVCCPSTADPKECFSVPASSCAMPGVSELPNLDALTLQEQQQLSALLAKARGIPQSSSERTIIDPLDQDVQRSRKLSDSGGHDDFLDPTVDKLAVFSGITYDDPRYEVPAKDIPSHLRHCAQTYPTLEDAKMGALTVLTECKDFCACYDEDSGQLSFKRPASIINPTELLGDPSPKMTMLYLTASIASTQRAIRADVQFLNFAAARVWPNVADAIQALLERDILKEVEEQVPEWLRPVKLASCDFGQHPPHIGPVEVYDKARQEVRGLELDLKVEWNATDADIKLQVGSRFTVGISHVKLRATVGLVFKPLLNRLPLVAGMQLFFLSPPDVDFRIAGSLQFLNAFKGIIQQKVQEEITSNLVLPKRLFFPFVDFRGDFARNSDGVFIDNATLNCPVPEGILRVAVKSGGNIRGADWRMGRNTSDVYVSVVLGNRGFRTRTVWEATNPVWKDGNVGDLLMFNSRQAVKFEVWDQDLTIRQMIQHGQQMVRTGVASVSSAVANVHLPAFHHRMLNCFRKPAVTIAAEEEDADPFGEKVQELNDEVCRARSLHSADWRKRVRTNALPASVSAVLDDKASKPAHADATGVPDDGDVRKAEGDDALGEASIEVSDLLNAEGDMCIDVHDSKSEKRDKKPFLRLSSEYFAVVSDPAFLTGKGLEHFDESEVHSGLVGIKIFSGTMLGAPYNATAVVHVELEGRSQRTDACVPYCAEWVEVDETTRGVVERLCRLPETKSLTSHQIADVANTTEEVVEVIRAENGLTCSWNDVAFLFLDDPTSIAVDLFVDLNGGKADRHYELPTTLTLRGIRERSFENGQVLVQYDAEVQKQLAVCVVRDSSVEAATDVVVVVTEGQFVPGLPMFARGTVGDMGVSLGCPTAVEEADKRISVTQCIKAPGMVRPTFGKDTDCDSSSSGLDFGLQAEVLTLQRTASAPPELPDFIEIQTQMFIRAFAPAYRGDIFSTIHTEAALDLMLQALRVVDFPDGSKLLQVQRRIKFKHQVHVPPEYYIIGGTYNGGCVGQFEFTKEKLEEARNPQALEMGFTVQFRQPVDMPFAP